MKYSALIIAVGFCAAVYAQKDIKFKKVIDTKDGPKFQESRIEIPLFMARRYPENFRWTLSRWTDELTDEMTDDNDETGWRRWTDRRRRTDRRRMDGWRWSRTTTTSKTTKPDDDDERTDDDDNQLTDEDDDDVRTTDRHLNQNCFFKFHEIPEQRLKKKIPYYSNNCW